MYFANQITNSQNLHLLSCHFLDFVLGRSHIGPERAAGLYVPTSQVLPRFRSSRFNPLSSRANREIASSFQQFPRWASRGPGVICNHFKNQIPRAAAMLLVCDSELLRTRLVQVEAHMSIDETSTST